MIFGNVFRWKQLWQQPLHFGWAALALLPIGLWGSHWWTGAMAGVLIDLWREVVDQWPLSRETDAPLDLLCFAIGGGLIGGLL